MSVFNILSFSFFMLILTQKDTGIGACVEHVFERICGGLLDTTLWTKGDKE